MSAVRDEKPPALPSGWHWTTMGEIAEVVGGGTPRTADPTNFEGGDIPWITPADLSGYTDKYISHGTRFITRKGLESSSARLLPAGTVLFTSRAPIGYVAIARNRVATNQGFKSFVLKDGVLPEYVYWWLKGSKQRAEALASGTTFLELSGASAKKLPIPIAPIDEQRRIVAEIEKQFSRLDEAVANLKRVKANLRRQRAAVLHAATTGTLLGDERRAEWIETTIGEVGQVISGLTKNPKRDSLPRKLPYLRVANVYANELRLDEIEFIGVADRELDKLLVHQGDLLIVEGNGSPDQIGRVALWDGSIENCVHQNHLIKVRFGSHVTPQWALTWLLSPGGRREIESMSSSTSGLHTLSTGKVARLPIPVPPVADQHRIVAEVDRRLSIVREVEAEVDANLKRAQAVLARAFAGATDAVPSAP